MNVYWYSWFQSKSVAIGAERQLGLLKRRVRNEWCRPPPARNVCQSIGPLSFGISKAPLTNTAHDLCSCLGPSRGCQARGRRSRTRRCGFRHIAGAVKAKLTKRKTSLLLHTIAFNTLLNSRSSKMVRPRGPTAWKAKASQTLMPSWTKLPKSHKPKPWLQQSKPSQLTAKVKLQGFHHSCWCLSLCPYLCCSRADHLTCLLA